MKDLAYDTYVVPADVVVPLLVEAHENAKKEITDPRVGHAVGLIKAWDRRSAVDSIAQTYVYFWAQAYRDLFSPAKLARFLAHSRYDIRIDSPEEQKMALDALKEAIRRIDTHFGKTDIPWGNINVLERRGTFPMDGTGIFDVLHVDEGSDQLDGTIHCNDGWGHLLVVEESRPKRAWSLLPYGESEYRASPHYNDMAKLHSQRRMKSFWFTPEEILGHTESVSGNKGRLHNLLRRITGRSQVIWRRRFLPTGRPL